MADFSKALKVVLDHEGGGAFSDHPADRGGPTRWGVTKSTLAAWRGAPVTAQDVEGLSLEEASEIYRVRYWNPIRGEDIVAQDVATKCLDIAVNMGVTGGSHVIQLAVTWCGLPLALDNKVGPVTLTSLNSIKPEELLLELRHAMRVLYLGLAALHPEQQVFLKGWLNRADWGVPPVEEKDGVA
jgi:lysozyme family protein